MKGGPGAIRALACVLAASLAGAAAAAETVTLPAAASIQGLAPFFTDVRVFNTSYTASLEVAATYRCFLGDCPGQPPRRVFTLLPRESAAFNDMVAADFHAPNSAGAVELDFDGAAEQVVATSRLYSTVPSPTVGMFVPGLPQSRAVQTAVLTSVRNRGPGKGFRTNVGVFNPGDRPVLVILTVLADGFPAGSPVVRTLLARSGVQVNAIFAVAGAPDTATSNGVVVVSASAPVYSYAAVIDNETTDPYLVLGVADRGIPTSTPTRTGTLPTFTPSRTSTPGAPTSTFTPSASPTATTTAATTTPTLTPSGPTATRTPSRTPTFTVTGTPPTSTPTFTPSRTPTGPSPTPTRTSSFTITPSVTRTFTATITPTPSRTFTSTVTGTATFTPSITPTASSTLTLTPTVSLTPTPTPTPIPNLVTVGPGMAFSPVVLAIHAGDTVTWQWAGSLTHTATTAINGCLPAPCPPDALFDSGSHTAPFTFTHTFTTGGVTIDYVCLIHQGQGMTATLNVLP